MVKGRYNFTLDGKVNDRLNKLVKESYKYTGRALNRSEVMELLINKAFISKREQLKERLMSLEKEKADIAQELDKLQTKEQMVMAGEF